MSEQVLNSRATKECMTTLPVPEGVKIKKQDFAGQGGNEGWDKGEVRRQFQGEATMWQPYEGMK